MITDQQRRESENYAPLSPDNLKDRSAKNGILKNPDR